MPNWQTFFSLGFMNIQNEVNKNLSFGNLELLANQVVEGLMAGMHKSPFHGFSSEFAEHKIYNRGQSTRHIDWKLFAKTDKLYTKRYDDETNLRCHIILDNSASMHYPSIKNLSLDNLNKIGFSVLAIACLIKLLKKQRDAVGLSIYSDSYDFYAPERGSERHHNMIFEKLQEVLNSKPEGHSTETYKYLHQIAENIHRRSLIVLFTDMFQTTTSHDQLFEALRHLKYNKHDVVLFHVIDKNKELNFDFDNAPKRYVDVETNEYIDLYSDQVKEGYVNEVEAYFKELRLRCLKYQIKYVEADIKHDFKNLLTEFLIERQKFA